uniref:Capsid protein n=1 Tax=Phyllosticta capitalensis polymycovirus 1 TaxID=3367395 RepID=A0AB74UEX5_9VIRU
MSFAERVPPTLPSKVATMSKEEFKALAGSFSLGFNPGDLYDAYVSTHRGNPVVLPPTTGTPKPLKVVAWSFVKDRGQYEATYGISSARAGELEDLLLRDREEGIAQIREIVANHPRTKASKRSVDVVDDGIPMAAGGTSAAQPSMSDIKALKAEIRAHSARYGEYKFGVEPTDARGSMAYRVRIGGGLYVYHQSKEGAVAAARIVRVNGRDHPLVSGHVFLALEGRTPVPNQGISPKYDYDGIGGPREEPLEDPVPTPPTRAGGGSPPKAGPSGN